MFLSFSGQCAGAPDQTWVFNGDTSSISDPHTGMGALAAGGLRPGAAIVSRPCTGVSRPGARSFGYSRLSLSGGRLSGSRLSGGQGGQREPDGTFPALGAGTRRGFAAVVTVSNAAAAMTAYGASVRIKQPGGPRVTRLAGTGALAGWACTLNTLSCGGSLPPSGRGQIAVGGTVLPQVRQAAPITAHAVVTGTSQAGRAAEPAAVPVRVFILPATAPKGGLPGGRPASAVARLGFGVAIALMIAGTLLAVITRRRQHPSPPPGR